VGEGGTDCIAVTQNRGQVAVDCVCGNEPSGSIECREFRNWFRTC
jgi:hypothetical protein